MNFSLYINSTAGIKNAKVFPEPVFAAPTKSRPSNNGGTDLAWISVSVVNPISSIPRNVNSQTLSFKEANVQLLKISNATSEPGTGKKLFT